MNFSAWYAKRNSRYRLLVVDVTWIHILSWFWKISVQQKTEKTYSRDALQKFPSFITCLVDKVSLFLSFTRKTRNLLLLASPYNVTSLLSFTRYFDSFESISIHPQCPTAIQKRFQECTRCYILLHSDTDLHTLSLCGYRERNKTKGKERGSDRVSLKYQNRSATHWRLHATRGHTLINFYQIL